MEKLIELLRSVRSDIDFSLQEKLVDDGLLDSFDIISIISEVNDVFDIEISADDITADNFNSAHSIFQLIQAYKNRNK